MLLFKQIFAKLLTSEKYLITRKSMKLREGNVFTRVCLSFITARKRSCRKIMFSQVCVCRGEGVGIFGPMFLPEVCRYLWYQVLSGSTQGSGHSNTWDTVNKQALHMLLECFLL